MAHHVERAITTSCAPERAFAFVADFSTTQEWDPGITAAERLDEGPIQVGSRFQLVSRFGSNEQTIVYEVAAYDPPAGVTFVGEGKHFRGTDTITFSDGGGGRTRVTYVADLGLKGVAALAMPFIRSRLDRMSDDAVAGLQRALDART